MRKWIVLLFCSVVLVFLGAACEKKAASEIQFGEKFITELYNVDDPGIDVDKMSVEQFMDAQNKFSPYFTEKEFKNLTNIRFFLIPLEVANKQKSKISVQNISFQKNDRAQKEGGPLDFDLTFTLIFTDQEGNKLDEVEMKGQMSIVKTEDGLKIDRYYDGKTLMDILYR